MTTNSVDDRIFCCFAAAGRAAMRQTASTTGAGLRQRDGLGRMTLTIVVTMDSRTAACNFFEDCRYLLQWQ
jgi:hypothetical protein